MAQKDKVKELVGRGLNSYHTKSLQQMNRIEKKNKEQNHKISILTNELDNDYLTKTEEGSVISLEHSKEGMVYLDELQGNTLVNYCSDGSKEMTLNGDIDVEGTFVTTTEGVDGGKIDVMCEGNTLVNLNKRFNSTQTSSWDATNSDYVVSVEGQTVDGGVLWYYTYLKPSTTYTMVVNILECTNMGDILLDSHYSYPPANMITLKKEVGVQKIVFNTKDSFEQVGTSIKIATYGKDTTNKLKISKHMLLLEGDWTDKEIPPYFEGMKSVGECEDNKIEILSQNKNLFAFNENKPIDLIEGYCESIPIYNNGTIYVKPLILNESTPSSYRNGYINTNSNDFIFKPFTSYKISVKLDIINNPLNLSVIYAYPRATNMTTLYYNSNTERYEGICSDKYDYSDVASNANANNRLEFRFCGIECNVSEIMVQEYEDTSTTYVPYSLNKKEILLNEPLRGLPNGIKDRFVKQGGKWYIERNCQKIQVLSTDIVTSYRQEENILRQTWTIAFHSNKIPKYTQRVGISNLLPHYTLQNINAKGLIGFDAYTEQRETFNYNTLYVSVSWSSTGILETDSEEQKNKKVLNWLVNNNAEFIIGRDIPTYEEITDIELTTYLDTTHISNNSTIPCNMKIQNSGYNSIIKPSTLYTVALDTNKSGTIGINLGGAKVTTTNNVVTITTPATLTDDSLRLYGKGIKGSKVRLLEGDKTNWIPSHFEGMKSSFEDKLQDNGSYKMEILMNNENLFDITKLQDDSTEHHIAKKNNANGFTLTRKNTGSGWNYSTWELPFKLKANTKYTISCKINKSNINSKPCCRLFDFTLQKDYAMLYSSGKYEFTTPTNGYERIKLLLYSSIDNVTINEGDTVNFNDIKISEVKNGDFVNHQSNKIQFSFIEPLRGVNDDIKDRFVFKDNKLMIERNCREVIFNGNTNWSIWSSFEDYNNRKTILFYTSIKGKYTHNCKCDRFYENGAYNTDYEGIKSGGNTNVVWFAIDKIKLNTLDKEGFNAWLRENNVKYCYRLENPIYEEIPFELQKIILEGYENGTLFFDTNIPPTSTVTYAGETPIVKSVRLNKTEVLNNTNDINDNIIPYLMDMDYRVVCLQLQSENINDGVSMARLFGGAYEMLKRDILSKRLTREEYGYRLADYFNAGKLTEEQVRELEDLR